ncbi:MAG: hypothetical protein SWX82_33110 [Cyanobacteriota bacterium]|nr:hypothetical protein [Cyanobacteriota bacterium]
MGRWGDWEMGRLGDWEMGRLGDGEIGRLGDWEIGRWGGQRAVLKPSLIRVASRNDNSSSEK